MFGAKKREEWGFTQNFFVNNQVSRKMFL